MKTKILLYDLITEITGRKSEVGKNTAVSLLCALFLSLTVPAAAQQPGKTPRIGYLSAGGGPRANLTRQAFLQGLRDLGYVEGKNILIEYRYAGGKRDRLPDLAAELVRLKVSVIFAAATPPAQVLKQATGTIPIVFAGVADPIAVGLVTSLPRPGGNITGLSTMSIELSGKRLELLKGGLSQGLPGDLSLQSGRSAQCANFGRVKARGA